VNFQPSLPSFCAASRAASIASPGSPASSASSCANTRTRWSRRARDRRTPSTARPAAPAFREARLLIFGQLGARQAEIAQRVIEDLLAFGGQRRVFGARRDRLVLFVQREVLADARPELGHARQISPYAARSSGVSATAFRWPTTPHAPERLRRLLDRLDDRSPGRRRLACAGGVDRAVGGGQQHVEGGRHVFRADLAETGQAGEIEERIGIGAGGH
jgi:hypothetical protein